MKKLPLLAFSFLLLSSCYESKAEKSITQALPEVLSPESGEPFEKKIELSIQELEVSSAIEAELFKDAKERIVLYGPKDEVENVLVEKENGKITLRFKTGRLIAGKHQVRARIYARDLSAIESSGGGKITLMDEFVQEKMDVVVGSGGRIKGNIQANELSVVASSSGEYQGKVWAQVFSAEASSSGKITVSGRSKKAVLQGSSSGKISAEKLQVEEASIQASSSSDVVVSVSGKADATASSSGEVRILRKGSVEVTHEENSSGRVTVH